MDHGARLYRQGIVDTPDYGDETTMDRAALTLLIESHPDRGSLPVACVLAICTVESNGNPWAYRHEPGYRWITGASISHSERMGQMMSWGLMQVMGAVAREHGFKGWFPQLCDPVVGLSYGMKHLQKYWAKHQNWPDTIASYNAGHPVMVEGVYRNQEYVNKVLKWWQEYDYAVPLKESEV
jgi:soluble lytic murein transglycosylase-like protein